MPVAVSDRISACRHAALPSHLVLMLELIIHARAVEVRLRARARSHRDQAPL